MYIYYINEIQLFYDYLTMSIVSPSLAGLEKNKNKKKTLLAPWPYFAHACSLSWFL